jgi:hypothetical protein
VSNKKRDFFNGKRKSEKMKKNLGYSFEDFKNYMINNHRIEQGYSWKHYLNGILSIDHIIPICLFPDTEEGIKKANQLINLRLITKNENNEKGCEIDMNLIEEYKLNDLYKQIKIE